jgi:hypothetical protein
MLDLLKNIHNKSEKISGKKILVMFVVIFVVCLPLGMAIGNLIKPKLNGDEIQVIQGGTQPNVSPLSYEGKIEYLNPGFHPDDNISFSLVDGSGKQIILLRSKDQKLNIAEGLFVKVNGTVTKTKDRKSDVLNVSEVIIKNVSN